MSRLFTELSKIEHSLIVIPMKYRIRRICDSNFDYFRGRLSHEKGAGNQLVTNDGLDTHVYLNNLELPKGIKWKQYNAIQMYAWLSREGNIEKYILDTNYIRDLHDWCTDKGRSQTDFATNRNAIYTRYINQPVENIINNLTKTKLSPAMLKKETSRLKRYRRLMMDLEGYKTYAGLRKR